MKRRPRWLRRQPEQRKAPEPELMVIAFGDKNEYLHPWLYALYVWSPN